jgi:hypothetical protein
LSAKFKKKVKELQVRLQQEVMHDSQTLATIHNEKLFAPQKAFEKSINRPFRYVGAEDVIHSINKCRVLLFGDFHTFKQSQRGFLRIIKSFVSRSGARRVALALECIQSKHQKSVDQFLSGRLDEAGLFAALQFDRTWGFEWPNFLALLSFARERRLPVIGINTESSLQDSLETRDRHMAGVLSGFLKENDKYRILCLVGEYHLAATALPAALENFTSILSRDITTVFCNLDIVFHSCPEILSSATTAYVRFDERNFCVVNSSPWTKWLSAQIWEEQRKSLPKRAYEHEDELYDEFDWDHFFLKIMRDVVDFSQLSHAEFLLDHFILIDASRRTDWCHFAKKMEIPYEQLVLWLEAGRLQGVVVSTDPNFIIFNNLTPNSIVQGAAEYIYRKTAKLHISAPTDESAVWTRVFSQIFAIFISKSFNPKRKTLNLSTARRQLALTRAIEESQENQIRTIKRVDEFIRLVEAVPGPRKVLKEIAQMTPYDLKVLSEILGSEVFHKMLRGAPDEADNSLTMTITGNPRIFENPCAHFINLILEVRGISAHKDDEITVA